jgi:hypothetical protein
MSSTPIGSSCPIRWRVVSSWLECVLRAVSDTMRFRLVRRLQSLVMMNMRAGLLSLLLSLAGVASSALLIGACGLASSDDPPRPGETGGGHDNGNGCIEGPCPDAAIGDPRDPIDAACTGHQAVPNQALFVPKWGPLAPTVPADCLRGFEINRLEQHTYSISAIQGSRAITLEIDIATYNVADAIRISASDGAANETILVETCRMRTSMYEDPTGGTTRPPEDSIRDYRVPLPAGSKVLRVDNTKASSPTYVRILGLCDFEIGPPPTTVVNSSFFRIVTSR